MGRWFGYRQRYEDICKIYLNEFLLEDFREYYEAEESLRNQFRQMERKEILPTDFGLKVPMKNPTSPNKARSTRLEGFVRNFSGKRKQLIFMNIDEKKHNTKVVKNLFNDLPKNYKNSYSSKIWKNIDYKHVINFLNSYKSPTDVSKFTEDRYVEYINSCNRYGSELEKWNVAFVQNDTGKVVSDNLIGFEFAPKSRGYLAKNKYKNKTEIKEWTGDPEDLKKYKGEDHDVYRIGTLTEPDHYYVDMDLSKEEVENILRNEEMDGGEALFWKKRRENPLLTIYPIKSPGDLNNNFIYFSYSLIFPYSKIVKENPQEFNKEWERINRVLIDQIERFEKLKLD